MSQQNRGIGFELFILIFLILINSIRASTFEPQENVPLTLFQLLARSSLVVHARVLDGEQKYAEVEVLETFRGTAPSGHLRLDFRDLNFERRGQDLVVFMKGEEYVLMLEPPDWRKSKEKNRDLFALYHGRRGRIALPAEGSEIQLSAVRVLTKLVGKPPEDQVAGLRDQVTSSNPFLREAALEEVGRLGAAGTADLPALSLLLQDPNPRIRASALSILRRVMPIPADELDESEKRTVLEICRERARNDVSEQVRAAAVQVMGAWPVREDVTADLRAISTGDASQTVRYEALRILFAWGLTGTARQP
jgi:HEAT repeat protein